MNGLQGIANILIMTQSYLASICGIVCISMIYPDKFCLTRAKIRWVTWSAYETRADDFLY